MGGAVSPYHQRACQARICDESRVDFEPDGTKGQFRARSTLSRSRNAPSGNAGRLAEPRVRPVVARAALTEPESVRPCP